MADITITAETSEIIRMERAVSDLRAKIAKLRNGTVALDKTTKEGAAAYRATRARIRELTFETQTYNTAIQASKTIQRENFAEIRKSGNAIQELTRVQKRAEEITRELTKANIAARDAETAKNIQYKKTEQALAQVRVAQERQIESERALNAVRGRSQAAINRRVAAEKELTLATRQVTAAEKIHHKEATVLRTAIDRMAQAQVAAAQATDNMKREAVALNLTEQQQAKIVLEADAALERYRLTQRQVAAAAAQATLAIQGQNKALLGQTQAVALGQRGRRGALPGSTGGFNAPNLAAVREIDQFARRVDIYDRGLGSMNRTLGKVATTAAVARAQLLSLASIFGVYFLVGAVAKIDRFQQSLEAVTDSAKELEGVMAFLTNTADSYGARTRDLASTYILLTTATETAGIALRDTQSSFESIVAAQRVLGRSNDDAIGALIALSQIAGKGVVSMEELRQQLGERLPGAIQILAGALNMTVGDLVAAVSRGEISARQFFEAFGPAALAKFGDAAKEIRTIDRAMSDLGNSFDKLLIKANAAGLSDGLRVLVDFFGGVLESETAVSVMETLAASVLEVGTAAQRSSDFLKVFGSALATTADGPESSTLAGLAASAQGIKEIFALANSAATALNGLNKIQTEYLDRALGDLPQVSSDVMALANAQARLVESGQASVDSYRKSGDALTGYENILKLSLTRIDEQIALLERARKAQGVTADQDAETQKRIESLNATRKAQESQLKAVRIESERMAAAQNALAEAEKVTAAQQQVQNDLAAQKARSDLIRAGGKETLEQLELQADVQEEILKYAEDHKLAVDSLTTATKTMIRLKVEEAAAESEIADKTAERAEALGELFATTKAVAAAQKALEAGGTEALKSELQLQQLREQNKSLTDEELRMKVQLISAAERLNRIASDNGATQREITSQTAEYSILQRTLERGGLALLEDTRKRFAVGKEIDATTKTILSTTKLTAFKARDLAEALYAGKAALTAMEAAAQGVLNALNRATAAAGRLNNMVRDQQADLARQQERLALEEAMVVAKEAGNVVDAESAKRRLETFDITVKAKDAQAELLAQSDEVLKGLVLQAAQGKDVAAGYEKWLDQRESILDLTDRQITNDVKLLDLGERAAAADKAMADAKKDGAKASKEAEREAERAAKDKERIAKSLTKLTDDLLQTQIDAARVASDFARFGIQGADAYTEAERAIADVVEKAESLGLTEQDILDKIAERLGLEGLTSEELQRQLEATYLLIDANERIAKQAESIQEAWKGVATSIARAAASFAAGESFGGSLEQGLGGIADSLAGVLSDSLSTALDDVDFGREISDLIGDGFVNALGGQAGAQTALAGAGAGLANAALGVLSGSVQQIGSGIGQAAGTVIGTAIAGPIGGAIGSLLGGVAGSLLGGLFGGGKPSGSATAFTSGDLRGSSIYSGSGSLEGVGTEVAVGVADLLEGLRTALNVTRVKVSEIRTFGLRGDNVDVAIGGPRGSSLGAFMVNKEAGIDLSDTVEALAKAMSAAGEITRGELQVLRNAVEASGDDPDALGAYVQNVLNAVDLVRAAARTYRTGVVETATEYQEAFRAVTENFSREATEDIRLMGVTVKQIRAARAQARKEIRTAFDQDIVNRIKDAGFETRNQIDIWFKAATEALTTQRQGDIATAREIGGNVNRVGDLYKNLFADLNDDYTKFLEDLTESTRKATRGDQSQFLAGFFENLVNSDLATLQDLVAWRARETDVIKATADAARADAIALGIHGAALDRLGRATLDLPLKELAERFAELKAQMNGTAQAAAQRELLLGPFEALARSGLGSLQDVVAWRDKERVAIKVNASAMLEEARAMGIRGADLDRLKKAILTLPLAELGADFAGLRDGVLGISEGIQQAIETLTQTLNDMDSERSAVLAELTQRAEAARRAEQALADARGDLARSELAPGGVLDRLAETQRQFGAAIAGVGAGDADAAENAARLAQDVLGLGRTAFGSDTRYSDLFRQINASLAQAQSQAGSTASQIEPSLDPATFTDVTEKSTEALLRALGTLNQSLAEIREEIEAQNDRLDAQQAKQKVA